MARDYAEFEAKHPNIVETTSGSALLICFLAGYTAGHALGAEEAGDLIMGVRSGKENG